MAAETSQTMWTVCIVGGALSRFYQLPVTTTIGEVQQQWLRDVGETEERWALKTVDGGRPDGLQCLSDIGESHAGTKVLTLIAERLEVEAESEDEVAMNFVILGQPDEAGKSVPLTLSKTPQEVFDSVRAAFELPQERYFRLLYNDDVLNHAVALAEQGVFEGAFLTVELGYEVEVDDIWSTVPEVCFIYANEAWEDQVSDDSGRQKLFLEDEEIEASRTVLSCLPDHMASMTRFRIRAESRKKINVLVNGRFRDAMVDPGDRLSMLIPSQPPTLKLKYNGNEVSIDDTFMDIGLREGGLISECMGVAVRLSSGQRTAVWVSTVGSVADLKEELKKLEVDGHFLMKCDNVVLHPEMALKNASIFGKPLEVHRFSHELKVNVAGKVVRWTSKSPPLTYSQLGCELMANSSEVKLKDLVDVAFMCDGCKRQIWWSEEEEQVVPVDCCHVRSLNLTSFSTVETKETGCQGPPKLVHPRMETTHMPIRTKKFGERPSTRAKWCQTEVGGVTKETQTRAGVGVESASTQQSAPEPRPFRLYNGTDTGPDRGRRENVSLMLSAVSTVGQVRAEVARFLCRTPENTRIRRYVGVFRGVPMVLVYDGRRSFFYTTEDGREDVEQEDVENGHGECLDDDAAVVTLPPGRRLYLDVYNR